ncbi:AMP-binding protein [Streptomyces thermolineatus]|uniref:AMP-binding protein n=1 Tax=Streptomyces thermolineatus TaxID=44033 RepID=UPI00384F1527
MPSQSFLGSFAESAEEHPDRCALALDGRQVTYRELQDAASWFRTGTALSGLPAGRPVCVPAVKTPETLALLLAALADRRQILLPSPELGEEVLLRLCRQASCSAVLLAGRDADGRPSLTVRAVEAVPEEAEGFRLPGPDEAQLMLTTSGSTGTPKIVPILAEAADRFMEWGAGQFGLRPGKRVLSYAPLNFDLSLLDVWAALRAGAEVVLVDQERATDAAYLAGLLEKYPVHLVQAVPLFYRLLLDGGPSGARRFPDVGHVVFTGDAMPYDLLRRLPDAFPGACLHNVFGCTETNDSFRHEVDPAAVAPGEVLPVGRPLPGVEAVVTGSDGAVLEGPCTGELLVSTPFQTSGYLETRRNADVFVRLPGDASGRVYYRTGDIVTRRADGLYLLEGRSDFHVKVRGVRVNLQEIEQVLRDHPEVGDAAVVALPDEVAGVRLHAQVQRLPGSGLRSLALRTHCSRHLPRPAVPASLVVADDPLPRMPTGKPDRNLIRKNRMEKEPA